MLSIVTEAIGRHLVTQRQFLLIMAGAPAGLLDERLLFESRAINLSYRCTEEMTTTHTSTGASSDDRKYSLYNTIKFKYNNKPRDEKRQGVTLHGILRSRGSIAMGCKAGVGVLAA